MNFLIGLLGQVASLIAGGIGGAISMVTGLVKVGYKQVLQYNQQGVALSRQMGLNAKEAQAYTSTLITRAKDLGKAYGLAAEQVVELQKNITNATSKQYMLNDAEAETMVQINKLVGSDVMNTFTSEMMNGMGGQLGAVQGAVSKAYATAAKSGLNAAQFSEKVAKNLSMANRLSFRDGVNGIIKMTALSEKLGINMASVEAAAKNFMDLDKAIENAAHMQMLGGSSAVMFGNPLTAAYEANYDPESFARRISDSLASYATFDANKGYASINGMNMDFVRNIAKAMGISEEDVVKNAKKQSEIKYKEGAFGATLGNYSQEQRDFILNKSYVENGKLMINDTYGNKHDISSGKLPSDMLKEMMKFTNVDDSELMRQQALSLTSIDERTTGWETSFFATIAEKINNFLPQIENIVNYIGEFATSEIAPRIAQGIQDIGTWLTTHGDSIKTIADTLTGTISSTLTFFSQSWRWLKVTLGLMAASYLFKGYQWIKNLPIQGQAIRDKFRWGSGGGSPTTAAPSGGASPAAIQPTSPTVPTKANPQVFKYNGQAYQYDGKDYRKVLNKDGKLGGKISKNVNQLERARLSDIGTRNANAARSAASNAATSTAKPTTSTVSTTSNAAKSGGVWNKLKSFGSGASKFAKIGGGVLGVGLAIGQGAMAISSYNKQKDELAKMLANDQINKNDYNTQLNEAKTKRNKSVGGSIGMGVGTAIGTALGGPIGAAIGGLIGQYGGQFIGKHWEDIKGFAKSAWESTKEMASSVWGGIKDLALGVWNLIPDDARESLSEAFETILPIFEGAFTVIKGIYLGAWEGIKGSVLGTWEIIKGVGLGIWEVIKGAWNGLWDIIAAPFKAVGEVISGFKNGLKEIFNGNITKGILTIFGGIGKGIFTVMSTPFKAIYDVGAGVFNGIGEVVKGVFNGVGEYVNGIWNGIGEYASGIWNGLGQSIDGIWGDFTKLGDGAWGKIGQEASKMWNGVGESASLAWNKFQSLASDVWNDIGNYAKGIWDKIANWWKDSLINPSNWAEKGSEFLHNLFGGAKGHAQGGIVGGNSYVGDKVLTRLNSGEMILNSDQQAALFSFINKIPNMFGSVQSTNVTSYRAFNNPLSNIINNTSSPNSISNIMTSMVSSILENKNDIRTKPVGEKEYIYIPNRNEQSNVNGNKITVNDFNINLSGTIKLDGGNNSKNVNVNALLNDFSFMYALKEMIKTSINNDMNGGRFMIDLATLRGQISSMSTYGC